MTVTDIKQRLLEHEVKAFVKRSISQYEQILQSDFGEPPQIIIADQQRVSAEYQAITVEFANEEKMQLTDGQNPCNSICSADQQSTVQEIRDLLSMKWKLLSEQESWEMYNTYAGAYLPDTHVILIPDRKIQFYGLRSWQNQYCINHELGHAFQRNTRLITGIDVTRSDHKQNMSPMDVFIRSCLSEGHADSLALCMPYQTETLPDALVPCNQTDSSNDVTKEIDQMIQTILGTSSSTHDQHRRYLSKPLTWIEKRKVKTMYSSQPSEKLVLEHAAPTNYRYRLGYQFMQRQINWGAKLAELINYLANPPRTFKELLKN